MKKKRRSLAVLILWFIFISMVAVIMYFSFQNGEDSKEMGRHMLSEIARSRGLQTPSSSEEMDALDYILRQGARVFAFLSLGIVGTVTIHVTCRRCSWLTRTVFAVAILTAVACLTERLKIYIPSRHYSYEEMLISLAAAAAGLLFVSFLTLLGKGLKGLSHLLTAGHTA